MEGRKIANLLQEGYRMPKPQHLDDKLYVNMVLLLLVFGFACLFVCVFLWLLSFVYGFYSFIVYRLSFIVLPLFGLHVHLKIHHFYLLNQPNEGK